MYIPSTAIDCDKQTNKLLAKVTSCWTGTSLVIYSWINNQVSSDMQCCYLCEFVLLATLGSILLCFLLNGQSAFLKLSLQENHNNTNNK